MNTRPFPRRRLMGGHRLQRLLSLIALVPMLLFPLPADVAPLATSPGETDPGWSPTAYIAPAATGPGETDPARYYAEWPDDEVFAAMPVLAADSKSKFSVYAPSSDLTTLGEIDSSSFGTADQHDAIAAASGRILTATHESVVHAYRSGSNVGVSFFRPSTTSPVSTLPNLASRLADSTDFLDVAVADLDGSRAVDGDYRDEVVVVYAQLGAGGRLPVQLTVLDFGQSSESAPTPSAVTTTTMPAAIDSASISSGLIKPADNVLAVATGDFDLSGLPEIALAYFASWTVLRIDFFRYSVTVNADGTVQRKLDTIGSSSITLPLDPYDPYAYGWWTETLSLAAGDLDGDGRDDLAVGTVSAIESGFRSYTQSVNVRKLQFTNQTVPTCSAPPCLTVTQ
ncbi:MAG: FG-GAP repeat protein [Chloroflexi bacterium]|nr:FG-GAP repeat protein [Chloroflexota bacterium]